MRQAGLLPATGNAACESSGTVPPQVSRGKVVLRHPSYKRRLRPCRSKVMWSKRSQRCCAGLSRLLPQPRILNACCILTATVVIFVFGSISWHLIKTVRSQGLLLSLFFLLPKAASTTYVCPDSPCELCVSRRRAWQTGG